jgi:hypothetical protein
MGDYMNSAIDFRAMHALYEDAPQNIKQAIDDAYSAAIVPLKAAGLKINGLDPSEELIAALTHFVIESNPELFVVKRGWVKAVRS